MRALYATDDGKAARAAGALLSRLGRRDHVEVTVVCVSDLQGVDTSINLKGASGAVERSYEHASEAADRAREPLVADGFEVNVVVLEGTPGAEIVMFQGRDPHDLIVIGAGNKAWMARLLHGSVSVHLLHSSMIPVLVVREAKLDTRVRVLVADDGSESAHASRQLLSELARRDTCDLTVMTAVSPVALAVVPNRETASMPLDSVDMAGLEHERIAIARTQVAETAAALKGDGFRVQEEVVVGHPAPEILKKIEVGGYELVTMGSRGLGQVARVALGSVSDAVTRHAPATLVSPHPS
jgi:nucleotide-binding universal stress UspA family protein